MGLDIGGTPLAESPEPYLSAQNWYVIGQSIQLQGEANVLPLQMICKVNPYN